MHQSMEEYIDCVLVDICKRRFACVSDQDDVKTLECETMDEFMRVATREQRAAGGRPAGSTTQSGRAAGVGPRGKVYVAPRFGAKFHVDRQCNGLRAATEVKEYEKCRLCG